MEKLGKHFYSVARVSAIEHEEEDRYWIEVNNIPSRRTVDFKEDVLGIGTAFAYVDAHSAEQEEFVFLNFNDGSSVIVDENYMTLAKILAEAKADTTIHEFFRNN